MALVLTRKAGEAVQIGADVVVTVTDVDRGKVRLKFEAPKGVPIYRTEVLERVRRAAAQPPPAD